MVAALTAALFLAVLLSGPAAAQTYHAAAIPAASKAPVVTKHPASVTVEEGQSASFASTASGSPTPSIQWERSTNGGVSWSQISGATSSPLTIASATTAEDGYQFRAVFKNTAGEAISKAATLTVRKAPAVTKQPTSVTVEEGQNAVFEASASGHPNPTVQWQTSSNGGATWTNVAGATSEQLTITNAKTSSSGQQYRAVFKNAAGTAMSQAATLTVRKAPAETKQPSNVTVNEGQAAVFEATASGFPTPTVQWEVSSNGGSSWSAVPGATSTVLTITKAQLSENGHQFRAVFTNAGGKATSQAATLTVHQPPAVSKQPSNVTVNEGQTAEFEATASGSPAPTVQWEVSSNGGSSWSPLAGATSPKLTIPNAKFSENGNEYRAVFTNVAGTVTSNAATLTVHVPPSVTQDPTSTTVQVGEEASFESAATGFPTPTVQWEVSTNGGASWSPVAGATSTTLTIAKPQLSENGRQFRAVFTNVAGKATSHSATLTVATNKYSAVAWGQNLSRQLGDGSANALSDVPVPVSGLKFVTSISAGGLHSLALLANGTAMAWGSNASGQLGDETTITREVPVAVKGLTGVRAIAAGGSHSLALLSNGTVMAWGDNEFGQLGTGNTAESEVPIEVKGLKGVRAIAAGANHSLALMANGAVMAWGDNEAGQLGTGNTKLSTVPVAVKGLTGVSSVSAGGAFSLALTTKETVEAWGSDESGQLGDSTFEELFSTVPIEVQGLSGVTAIAAGDKHGMALLGAGTVMAWGENLYGEVGNGTMKARQDTAVPVTGLSGVTAITAGGQDSAALLTSGGVMAWGINKWGTLGNGATGSPSALPVTVAGIRQVASVSAGGLHMLAYGEPIPVVTSVSPTRGPTLGGTSVAISGANLNGATGVKFGSVDASSFAVNSATSITATAPAGAPGTVHVSVTTPSGTSPSSSADSFTYIPPPQVTAVKPKTGTAAGGTSVTIGGSEFIGVTAVRFGSVEASKFTVVSTTSITAVVPAGSPGPVDVTVTTEFGTSPLTTGDRFTYQPAVTGLSPNAGSVTGGTSITVTGAGFVPGSTSFKFGSAPSKSVSCLSSTECTVIAPAHPAGTVDVIATVNKVSSLHNPPADQFTYS
jgi:alpha-tubulin suppressor-like RCC1 family protein